MNLRRILRRSREDAELSQELESHLQYEIDGNMARGMSPEEARRQASVKLGNPLVIRERVWGTNRIAWLEDTWRDLTYAARTLRKTPSFTCIAVLVMALGIGANTAIFSFLDALLLRSLPVSDPHSLVVIGWHAKSDQDSVTEGISGRTDPDPHFAVVGGIFPYPAFELFQKDDADFSDVFAHCHTREVSRVNVVINGQAELARGELVSGGYFKGLGVVPAAGRLIIPDDDRPGNATVAVLSHTFAQKYFVNTNPVGQPILVNNLPFTVVGVAPAEFFGVDSSRVPDIYLPVHANVALGSQIPYGFTAKDYLNSNYYWAEVMARLRPGVTLEQAQSRLATQFQSWVATTVHNDAQKADLPILFLRQGATGLDILRRQFSQPLYMLLTLTGLILAIACFNVANLLLARAASRKREIALRISEGASRLRIIRQLMTESLLLASVGGALGLLLAIWGIQFLTALFASQGNLHAELNWHVLAVAAALTLLTGLFFGLVPALQSTKLDLVSALKETRAGDAGSHRPGWRVSVSHALVVGQIAISLLMLVAAGLFVRTLSNLESVRLGFNRENLLLIDVNARQTGHKDPGISDFYGRLRESLAAIPGVRNVSLSESSIISTNNSMPIALPGLEPNPATRFLSVGPDYLTTMQIPLVAGRDFANTDTPTSPPVTIVSEEFARINFPGQNPLGHRLLLLEEPHGKVLRDMEIVGVSRDARYGDLTQKTVPVVFIPYNQGVPRPNQMTFLLRTVSDPAGIIASVRDVVRQADARLPLSNVQTQKAEITDAMQQQITLAELCSALAVLALIIACVGLYGTISYTVARRTGEIGIRIALGARRGPVVWMVLREVCVLAGVGLAISVPIALATSKFVQSFLFGMQHNDPLALGAAMTILVGAAVIAGCVPARRAASIDPVTALRHE
ncbi:MAG TPA: ABC transporter permease [Candidatus Sulfotelmatobacter sp.]|nr:ABC transporter permease [Candidatus Sulfotelmatobacter sp.]